jgi:hypothetical protein
MRLDGAGAIGAALDSGSAPFLEAETTHEIALG